MFRNVLTNDLVNELIEIGQFEVKYFRCNNVWGHQSFADMNKKYAHVKSVSDLVTILESLYRITFNKHCEVIKLWFNIVKQDSVGYDWHTHSNTTAIYYLFNTENSGTLIDNEKVHQVDSIDNSLLFLQPNIKHKVPLDWKGKDRMTIAINFND